MYSCNFKYDISTYTDYNQCRKAPPPPQTSSSSSSGSSGCQCSCCLGSQCTKSDIGTVSGVGLRATFGLAPWWILSLDDHALIVRVTDATSCTPDSCRTAYPSSCPAVGANGVVSSNYVVSNSGDNAYGLNFMQNTCFGRNLKVCLYRYIIRHTKWQVRKLLSSLCYCADTKRNQNNGEPPCG